MKKQYKDLIIILIFTIITFLYSLYIFRMDNDEIWNYGFAHNIYTGLIPYRDFNMIIPPLFAFCTIPFFLIFGDNLFSFHLFSSLVSASSILIMYKKIGKKAFLIYPIMMIAYLPSYNLFCIMLCSLLILVNDSKNKYRDHLLGLIVSLIFLTKQTIGICLLIPCLFYSKNKIKTIISFMIPILLFTIYLIINNALYEFIDYCFLGMFSFTSNNGNITINTGITILLCILAGYKLIKSKFKKAHYFYAIMFQVMILPMGDNLHFYTSVPILLFSFLIDTNLSKYIYTYIFIFLYTTVFLIKCLTAMNQGIELNIYKEKDSHYYGRNISTEIINYVNTYNQYLEQANIIGYDHLFVFSQNAYFLKLYNSQELNKFDLINNGNMGYKSYKGYIEDIDSMCKNRRCIFIVEQHPKERLGQTNTNLLEYPKENYRQITINSIFNMYINDNITK